MSERPKPPARRAGRTLGGAKKTAAPPPPAAELTPEQLAAESAAESAGAPPTAASPSAGPASAEQASAEPQSPAVPVAESLSNSTVPAPALQGTGPSAVSPSGQEAVTEAGTQPDQSAVGPGGSADPTFPSNAPTGLSVHSPSAASASAPAQGADLPVLSIVPPTVGSAAFPVRTDAPGGHFNQGIRPDEGPSAGTPPTDGPGRPADIPEASAVLNQRVIKRESLDSSVPAVLRLKKRMKRFALDNEIDDLPIGDIVAVALDEWLNARGY